MLPSGAWGMVSGMWRVPFKKRVFTIFIKTESHREKILYFSGEVD